MIARTLAALAALAVLAAGAPAQDTRPTQPAVAAGRVVRLVGQDTVAAAGVRVWLHRVARDTQGPIDSTTSGPGGSFHFAFRADSSSIYLASASWLGIEYFSIPIITHGKDAGRPFTLVVSDTSAMVPIAVEARHIVIGRPSQDGSRSVADLIVLSNASNLTRTPAGADGVSWRVTLPASAGGLQLGESDFAQDAVVQRGDTLFLRAPIPPGNRQVTLTYVVPPNLARFEVPVDGAVPTVSVLSEDPALQVLGGLTRGDTTSVSGRVFTRWSGALAGGIRSPWSFPPRHRLPVGCCRE